MKKLLSLFLVIGLLFAVSTSALAQENTETSALSTAEISILINEVGLTEEEVELYPIQFSRELIAGNAKKLSNNKPQSYNLVSEGPTNSGGISPYALTTDDITLNGAAFETTSDVPGSKKFILVGTFYWNVEPFWNLTDKMSIGYPVTNEWYLRTSGGSILGHSSEMCNFEVYWDCDASTTPANHDLGVGVAAKFDLSGTAAAMKGWVQQYVYSEKSSGRSNVLFRYGHKIISGTPAVSIYPVGLAVTPSTTTETLDYVIDFDWD
jgi:hypothetical protein